MTDLARRAVDEDLDIVPAAPFGFAWTVDEVGVALLVPSCPRPRGRVERPRSRDCCAHAGSGADVSPPGLRSSAAVALSFAPATTLTTSAATKPDDPGNDYARRRLGVPADDALRLDRPPTSLVLLATAFRELRTELRPEAAPVCRRTRALKRWRGLHLAVQARPPTVSRESAHRGLGRCQPA